MSGFREDVWSSALGSIAGGASSNARTQVPLVVERGVGPRIRDTNGREYVDYMLGMGPAILGHSPAPVIEAVARSLALGQCLGATHPMEIALAERLRALFPSMELMRFTMTGTEAVQAALRLARAATGRRVVVKFEGHYHGWLDNVLVSLKPSPNSAGPADAPLSVPETRGQAPGALADTIVLPWNDAGALERCLAARAPEIAAVIMEPVMCNTVVIPPEDGYLARARTLCDRHDVPLVFDEVITGMRVGLSGAQGLYGVRPDLTILAKAVAGGFPLAVVGGRRDIMEEFARGVFHGGTYNASLPAVAAALATIEELSRDDGAALQRALATGTGLMNGLREEAARHGRPVLARGWGTVFTTAFTAEPAIRDFRGTWSVDGALQARFAREMHAQGVRVSARGNWYVSTAHEDAEVEETLAAAREAFAALGDADG